MNKCMKATVNSILHLSRTGDLSIHRIMKRTNQEHFFGSGTANVGGIGSVIVSNDRFFIPLSAYLSIFFVIFVISLIVVFIA